MGQVDVFNVELVVVVHVGHLTPIGIAGRPHRRLFVDRHGISFAVGVQGSERAIDVDARDHDPPLHVGLGAQRLLGVRLGQGTAVDDGVRAKGVELTAVRGQLVSFAM